GRRLDEGFTEGSPVAHGPAGSCRRQATEEEENMPEILVITTPDGDTKAAEEAVLLRERVSLSDFESGHFCGQLVERIGWAGIDAQEVDQATAAPEAGKPPPRPAQP